MTFLLGVGTAATGPALQAVLPELVPPKDMALAINLNSVALNVARAVGPATFISSSVVWSCRPAGSSTGRWRGVSFLLSALTFVGAVWVLVAVEAPAAAGGHARRRRLGRDPLRLSVHGPLAGQPGDPPPRGRVHRPGRGALVAGAGHRPEPARHAAHAGQLRPAVRVRRARRDPRRAADARPARPLQDRPGRQRLHAAVRPRARSRCRSSTSLWLAAIILVFLGVNWVIIPTNFNTATQKSVPLWVKGRAISFYLTVLFGSFAIGGALWGKVTTQTSIQTSLLLGGTVDGRRCWCWRRGSR